MNRLSHLLLMIFLLPGSPAAKDLPSTLDSLCAVLSGSEPESKSPVFNRIAQTMQNTDTAVMYADSAILYARVFGNAEQEADGLRTKGFKYFVVNRDTLAVACWHNATTLYEKARKRKEVIQVYVLMARSYNFMGMRDTADYFLDRARDIAESINDRYEISEVLFRRADIARRNGEFDRAILFYDRSVAIKKEIGDREGLAKNYASLGLVNYLMGQYGTGGVQLEQALDLYEELDDPYEAGRMLLRIGNINIQKGNHEQAVGLLKQALEKFEQVGDEQGISAACNSLSVGYGELKDYGQAILYQGKNLEISIRNDDKQGMAFGYNNLGTMYAAIAEDSLTGMYGADFLDHVVAYPSRSYLEISREAVTNYEKALELEKGLGNLQGIAGVLHNLGSTYMNAGKFGEAQESLLEALDLYRDLNDYSAMADVYILLGEIKTHQEAYARANNYLKEALSISEEMQLFKPLAKTYRAWSRYYQKQGQYRTALEYQAKYQEIRDTLHTYEMDRLNEELDFRLDMERESNAQKIQQVYTLWEQQKQLEEARTRNRNILLLASLFILLLLAVFAVYVFRALRLKQRANRMLREQKEEIEAHKDEIEAQRDEITGQKNILEDQKNILEEQKKAITSSIQYASRIQSAILPKDETIQHFLPKHFILFKPRDIVSGDFYWMDTRGNRLVVAAVDCTGHGVPGSIMSMLGSSLLNEILSTYGEIRANEILDELRDRVILALHQTGREGEAKDGMDMSLCVFDQDRKHVQFAGAHNSLYFVREGELTEIKGDRMPIGISMWAAKPFTRHDLDLKKGDALYMFSDGYIDQFGGVKGKKFMATRFKEVLLEVQDRIMFEQKQVLERELDHWMNPPEKPELKYEQVDDILVMGIKI